MKSLAFIAILSSVFLSGCASYGYQRNYDSYGGGYSSGYSYSSYPATGYYRQTVLPGYSQHYSPPSYGHNHGGARYDWDRSHDRHDDMQSMERRLEHQEHAIRRGVQSGDLTRGEASRLQQDANRIEHNMERVQRGSWVPEYRRQRLEQDLDRSQQRIHQFNNNDATAGSGHERGGSEGWGHGGHRH